MNNEPLDESYFCWLYVQVASTRLKNPARTFWHLLRQLYTTEFTWFIPNDDNRVEEGKALRYEFLEMNPDANPDPVWLEEGSSFLEMLVALSRRLSFEDERASSEEWFWQLMSNINLVITDSYYENGEPSKYVSDALQVVNDRTYDFHGKGGLFPLAHTEIDQAHVEIWYQMTYYLIERG